MDNVFIERLWRSLKHEDIYLKGYADGRELHEGLADCLLQQPPPSPGAAPSHPDGGLAQLRHRKSCGHVGNARALPTCPQPQQQQQTDFLAA